MKKFLIKYKSMSLELKCSIWFAFCSFLQKCVSLVSMPIFSRILSIEEYGLLSIYSSWYTVIFYFSTLNLANAFYNTLVNKNIEKKHDNACTIMILISFITLLIMLVIILFQNFFTEKTGLTLSLLIIICISCVFSSAYSLWQVQQRYEKKYKSMVFITFVFTALSIFVPVLFVLLGDKTAENKIIGTEIITIIFGGILIIYYLLKATKIIDFKTVKHALSYSIPLLPHFLTAIFLTQLDRVMIYNFYGYEESALYGTAHTLGNLLSALSLIINNTYVPYLYSSIKNGRIENSRKVANYIVFGAMIFLFIFQLFTPEIVKVFLSDSYYSISSFVPILALGQFFVLVYYFFANVEYYYGKTYLVMIASIIGCLVNLILNLWLIPYNYYFAAYTTTFSYFIYVLLHYLFMRLSSREKFYDIKKIIISMAIAIVSTLVSILLQNLFVIRLIVAILLLIASLLLIKNKIIKRNLRKLKCNDN